MHLWNDTCKNCCQSSLKLSRAQVDRDFYKSLHSTAMDKIMDLQVELSKKPTQSGSDIAALVHAGVISAEKAREMLGL